MRKRLLLAILITALAFLAGLFVSPSWTTPHAVVLYYTQP